MTAWCRQRRYQGVRHPPGRTIGAPKMLGRAFRDSDGKLYRGKPTGRFGGRAAFRGIDMELARTRAFLDLIAPEAEKIEIPVGGQVSAQAKLIPAEKIKAAEAKLP